MDVDVGANIIYGLIIRAKLYQWDWHGQRPRGCRQAATRTGRRVSGECPPHGMTKLWTHQQLAVVDVQRVLEKIGSCINRGRMNRHH